MVWRVACLLLALLAAALATGLKAETIGVSAPDDLAAAIAADCPDCAAQGYLPCGTPDVAYGQRFPATAMQGRPERAYLLARAPVSKELTPYLAAESVDALAAGFRARFAPLRLVVIEADWRTARTLAPIGPPRIHADPAQQACFRDPGRSASCCLGDGPRDRGCLPKADPPSASFTFLDPVAEERLTLRYPVGRGEVSLRRAGDGGALYWCHKWTRAGLAPAR